MKLKKKLIISLVAILLPFAGEARNALDNNWFIQADIGGRVLLGENFALRTDIVTQSVTFAPSFAVGTWITPNWGFRLKGEGGNLHSFPAQTSGNLGFRQEDFYLNAHINVLWNTSSYLCLRRFSVIPYAGIGGYFRDDRGNEWDSAFNKPTSGYHAENATGITIHGGLLLEFHLNEHIGIHFDASGVLVPNDKINRWYGGRGDGIITAAIGLTFNIGGRKPAAARASWCPYPCVGIDCN